MTSEAVVVELGREEVEALLDPNGAFRESKLLREVDDKLRAALASDSQGGEERDSGAAYGEHLQEVVAGHRAEPKSEQRVHARRFESSATSEPCHGCEIGNCPNWPDCQPEQGGDGDWPEVKVVRAIDGDTPGLPKAYVNEDPPISYRQHPEIWEVRRYVPAPPWPISAQPIPPEDLERAGQFVKERGWVAPTQPSLSASDRERLEEIADRLSAAAQRREITPATEEAEADAELLRHLASAPERPECGFCKSEPTRRDDCPLCGVSAPPPGERRLEGEQAQAVIVDFLTSWRFCPVSQSSAPARSCLEDAAKQLLDALRSAPPEASENMGTCERCGTPLIDGRAYGGLGVLPKCPSCGVCDATHWLATGKGRPVASSPPEPSVQEEDWQWISHDGTRWLEERHVNDLQARLEKVEAERDLARANLKDFADPAIRQAVADYSKEKLARKQAEKALDEAAAEFERRAASRGSDLMQSRRGLWYLAARHLREKQAALKGGGAGGK